MTIKGIYPKNLYHVPGVHQFNKSNTQCQNGRKAKNAIREFTIKK